jgi:LPXTG-motif cell wall-anchored protein
MIRLTLAAAFAFALLVPAVALAKGPTAASISGPGFSKKLAIRYDGAGNGPGGLLTEQSGLFPAVFGQSPDPMLHRRPAGRLGPRYRIVWTVPGGGGENFILRQDLYPYARGGAVTYMKPGQSIFDMTTRGGWYRNPELKGTLVGMGLAKRAPSGSAGNGTNYALLAGIGIPGALALAGAGFFVARRRRSA